MFDERRFFTSKPENEVISGRSKITAGRRIPTHLRHSIKLLNGSGITFVLNQDFINGPLTTRATQPYEGHPCSDPG